MPIRIPNPTRRDSARFPALPRNSPISRLSTFAFLCATIVEIVRNLRRNFSRRFFVSSRAFLWPFSSSFFRFVLIRVHSCLPSFGYGLPLCALCGYTFSPLSAAALPRCVPLQQFSSQRFLTLFFNSRLA